MNAEPKPESARVPEPTRPASRGPRSEYQRPAFDVIALDCEITAYAPDGDDPLF